MALTVLAPGECGLEPVRRARYPERALDAPLSLARPRQPQPEVDESSVVANIKSQIKRIQTNEKARLRNKSVKSSLKTSVRSFREAAAAGDAEKAVEAMRTASRQLDKAVSKGVIHSNQAANKKSAMAKQVAAL